MASKSLCRSCLNNLHRQVRAQTRQSVPGSISLRDRHTDPISYLGRALSAPSRRYASTITGNAPAPGHVDLPQSAPTSAKVTNAARDQGSTGFEQYVAIPATESLFKECASQADYIIPQAFDRKTHIPKSTTGEDIGEGSGWWYETLGLTPTFNTWAQITMLHLYLLTARMRYFPAEHSKTWQQHLHDHFFYECEHRMTIFHGMTARSIRNRNLKELYNQWRGVIGAYDEGLIKGDAVLGTAVWRNIFKADEQADWRDVAMVTSFMRRGLKALDKAQDKTVVSASVRFGSPASEKAVVGKQSSMMNRPFTKEDEEGVQELLGSKQS